MLGERSICILSQVHKNIHFISPGFAVIVIEIFGGNTRGLT
jgi:hypothetical protein